MTQFFDFDQKIERRNSGSRKWDGTFEFFGSHEVLPMWIADMDFKAPPAVMQAVLNAASHGVYGYPLYKDEFYQAIIKWQDKRHGWKVNKEWLLRTPGVMPAISAAILAFTKPSDKIIIQTPVYPAFFDCITKNGRQVARNPLIIKDGQYSIDFDNLENLFKSGAKVLLFCSPHNPVGRVWTKDELCQVGTLCEKYNALILADEIHHDLVFSGHKHTVVASIKALERRTVTFTAPSKTFNIAGFYTAATIVPDEKLRQQLKAVLEALEIDKVNLMGVAAATAAYQEGDAWLTQLLVYLEGNRNYIQQFIHNNISEIKLTAQQGTYLMWLDFRELYTSQSKLSAFLLNDAKVALSDGAVFGETGFMRLNFGCPRSTLKDGLTKIAEAVKLRRA